MFYVTNKSYLWVPYSSYAQESVTQHMVYLSCLNAAHTQTSHIFTVQRYAGMVYAVSLVCLSVHLLQAGIVAEWLNVGLHKQRRRH